MYIRCGLHRRCHAGCAMGARDAQAGSPASQRKWNAGLGLVQVLTGTKGLADNTEWRVEKKLNSNLQHILLVQHISLAERSSRIIPARMPGHALGQQAQMKQLPEQHSCGLLSLQRWPMPLQVRLGGKSALRATFQAP